LPVGSPCRGCYFEIVVAREATRPPTLNERRWKQSVAPLVGTWIVVVWLAGNRSRKIRLRLTLRAGHFRRPFRPSALSKGTLKSLADRSITNGGAGRKWTEDKLTTFSEQNTISSRAQK